SRMGYLPASNGVSLAPAMQHRLTPMLSVLQLRVCAAYPLLSEPLFSATLTPLCSAAVPSIRKWYAALSVSFGWYAPAVQCMMIRFIGTSGSHAAGMVDIV